MFVRVTGRFPDRDASLAWRPGEIEGDYLLLTLLHAAIRRGERVYATPTGPSFDLDRDDPYADPHVFRAAAETVLFDLGLDHRSITFEGERIPFRTYRVPVGADA